MLVVLSDLHFSEAQSTKIGDRLFNRNLSPENYRAYFSEINQFAKANNINKVDLILAGDIFEISRSSIWLDGPHRPYVNNEDVKPGSDIEKTILTIMDAIAKEYKVSETLAIFKNIQNFFEMKVRLYLILGNHDRLVNATPKIREVFREMFGLSGGSADIPNSLVFPDDNGDPFCLVRHGHEYDPTNFSWDIRSLETIPLEIPKLVYDKASLGDITTIEFGAALPWLFEKEYGEQGILDDPTLLALYKRLMEFDDVRPTTAWLSYLFATPGVKRKKTWELMKPAFTEIINTLADHDEFDRTLKQSAAMSNVVCILLLGVLRSGIFKRGIPYWMIKAIMRRVSKTIDLQSQVQWAKREALIQDIHSGCKCVISGHTHLAEVSLISTDNGIERYYINTGTWRNVIPATSTYTAFGHLKALTKVTIFYPKEQDIYNNAQDWAFRFMSGMSFGQPRYF